MNNAKGLSLVALMIIIAVMSLLLRIVVEGLIKMNIAQNESGASATLKLISTALENYAKDNKGVFPASIAVLTKGNPAYLDNDYISESPLKGYNYICPRLEPSGYNCSALPLKCKRSGAVIYSISTGGSLLAEDCAKRE